MQDHSQAWIALAEAGYWVFPTTGHRKAPPDILGRTWGDIMDAGEQEVAHAHLIRTKGSGAILCPQTADRTALVILDVDAVGLSLAEVWAILSPDEDLPEGTLVVSTPSGGFHLWFRLPPDVIATRLPAHFDMGQGVEGEVRVSGKARRLIMLPGSEAMSKQGRRGAYSIDQGELRPESLPWLPESLAIRLIARPKQGEGRERGGKPTEALHFLAVLEHLGELPKGQRNEMVAHVGQVLGRMHPGKAPDPDLILRAEAILEPLLDHPPGKLRASLNSGWKTGAKNAVKYAAREKHPSITDIRIECEGVLGGVPWLVEVFESGGKLKEYLVGFGGSPKRRHEATKVVAVRDLSQVLPALTRLASAQADAVVRSPLFIQAGWARALHFLLHLEKGADHLGLPVEDRFWATLEGYAHAAAQDHNFIEAWTEQRPGSAPFIVWLQGEEIPPALVIPPTLQEGFLSQLGDLPKARSLKRKHLLDKALRGMRGGAKAWMCATSSLPPALQAFIEQKYDEFLSRKLSKEKH